MGQRPMFNLSRAALPGDVLTAEPARQPQPCQQRLTWRSASRPTPTSCAGRVQVAHEQAERHPRALKNKVLRNLLR